MDVGEGVSVGVIDKGAVPEAVMLGVPVGLKVGVGEGLAVKEGVVVELELSVGPAAPCGVQPSSESADRNLLRRGWYESVT